MTFAPFLGSASIPWKVKSGLTFVLTALLMPAYSSRMPHVMPGNWAGAVGGELMIGLGMGLTLELVFEAARFAGQLLGFQFGYSLVNVIDPQSQVEISVLNFSITPCCCSSFCKATCITGCFACWCRASTR